jgi:hypothetical protein
VKYCLVIKLFLLLVPQRRGKTEKGIGLRLGLAWEGCAICNWLLCNFERIAPSFRRGECGQRLAVLFLGCSGRRNESGNGLPQSSS